MNEKWYNIQNKAGETADIYIFDEIGTYGITAQELITDIKDLKNKPINLRINSLGGDVFDGMAMYNVIKRREAKTTVYIEGIAASIATIIALVDASTTTTALASSTTAVLYVILHIIDATTTTTTTTALYVTLSTLLLLLQLL